MKNKTCFVYWLHYTLFACLLGCSFSSHAHISETSSFPLKQYEARYSISWFGIPAGESVHKLHQRQDGYYHFETKTVPLTQMLPYRYHESTDFAWDNGQFIPHNYYYDHKEGKRHKKGNVSFNWEKNLVQNKELKQPWETELTQGIQDKLTQTLSIRHALKTGSRSLSYTVAEEDKIKQYVFSITGEEMLKTKLGAFQTVKVEHVSRKGVRTTLWLAQSLDYLPVKMTQMRQGKIVANGEILALK